MAYQTIYRAAVISVLLGGLDGPIPQVALGYSTNVAGTPGVLVCPPTVIKSESSALSSGMAFARRLRSQGQDVRVAVYESICDLNAPALSFGIAADPNSRKVPANPSYVLTDNEKSERNIANATVMPLGLLQKMNANNKAATSLVFDPDQDVHPG